MSKVICDVCGTTYPETATQCPICGCAKNSVNQTAASTDQETGESAYSYVKGGRFSEKNVKKRTSGSRTPERRTPGGSGARTAAAPRTAGTYSAERRSEPNPRRRTNKEEEKSNLGLIIIVILLLIAIIAVVIHLAVRYLGNDEQPDTGKPGTNQNSTDPVDSGTPSTPSDPANVPCEDLQVSPLNITFSVGDSWTLNVKLTPENTTEKPEFTSVNPAVATVDEHGVVNGIADGTTTITVKCGSKTQTCTVVCGSGTVTPPNPPVENFKFEFNTRYKQGEKWDVTLSKQGETWQAYKNDVSVAPELITWIIDDPSVCTVDKGIVTAVGGGHTEIHAQYNGQTYTCIVNCSFKTTGGNGGEQQTPAPTGDCTISHTDVTLYIGGDDNFKLQLKDSNGKVLDVTWTASAEGYVSINGNKITALSEIKKGVNISTTYEGVTYTCIVRVYVQQ